MNAEYFARALWGSDTPPDGPRIAKAKRVAAQFHVKWEDIEKLAADGPRLRVARLAAPDSSQVSTEMSSPSPRWSQSGVRNLTRK